MIQHYSCTVESVEQDPVMRVDAFLAAHAGIGSRSQLKQRLESVQINGQPAKLSALVSEGDVVTAAVRDAESREIQPEALAAPILFENADVITLYKPAGMVVHPAVGNYTGTLLQGLLGHVEQLSQRFCEEKGFADEDARIRPGIVHRLDKDTSGVLIAAKHPAAHAELARQFSERRVGKLYLAVVKGRPGSVSGEIDTGIARDPRNRKRFTAVANGGRAARTRFRVIQSVVPEGDMRKRCSLVALYPRTGRTHQLRVHMQSTGCPILGDPLYSRLHQGESAIGLMLHAGLLEIAIPGESSPRLFFAAPCGWHERLGELGFSYAAAGYPADRGWCESQLRWLTGDHWPEK